MSVCFQSSAARGPSFRLSELQPEETPGQARPSDDLRTPYRSPYRTPYRSLNPSSQRSNVRSLAQSEALCPERRGGAQTVCTSGELMPYEAAHEGTGGEAAHEGAGARGAR